MAAAEIINVDVADPPLNLSIAEEQALIVFWWRDYPVGQEWIRGAKRRLIEVKPLVDRIVDSRCGARCRGGHRACRRGVGCEDTDDRFTRDMHAQPAPRTGAVLEVARGPNRHAR